MREVILDVKGLKKYFPISKGDKKGLFVKAIDGIDFTIREGETLGLVGESGSGKSTTAYNVIGMYHATAGQMTYKGHDISMASAKRELWLKRDMQMVFQDPGTTLNPQRNIKQILSLPLQIHNMVDRSDPTGQLIRLLDMVGLPAEYLYKYPMSLGGGERQMLAIARALSTDPSMIVLDEPTSSLDVSVQAKIINMLLKFQRERNLSYLFITHDLSLMRNLATKVAIMYLGKIVETGEAKEIFNSPLHPYTRALIDAVPVPDPKEREKKKKLLEGEIGDSSNPPEGCRFHPRCPYATDTCKSREPELVKAGEGPEHYAACPAAGKKLLRSGKEEQGIG